MRTFPLRWCGCVGLLILLFAAPADAAVRLVVLLQSFDRGSLVVDRFTADFRVQVNSRSGEPVTFIEFVVSPAGFNKIPEQAIVDFMRGAFAGRPKPDLVVTVGGPATTFARKYRTQLFPDVPLLLAAVDQRYFRDATLAANETAVTVANDPAGVVDDILRVFPDTEHVFVVLGAGELGRFWRQEFERASGRFTNRVQFLWADGLSYAELLQRVSTLPPRSAIFFQSFDVDASGASYSTERALRDLHALANAPIFGAQGAELGYGIVGGNLLATDEAARAAADAALQILQGTPPASIRMPVQQPGPPMFDWRELQRWNVSEGRLPAGSVVRFREPGVWARYRLVIVGGVSAMLAQTLLISALLVQRVKRRRAEHSLRESEGRFGATMSQLNRRLIQAQEQERTRLARELHDDVCQRTTVVALNLQRLSETFPERDNDLRGQLLSLYDDVTALGRDVNGISHRLHSSKLEFLGLTAAARAFCKETATQHGVDIDFVHEDVPAQLPDGVPINLFRVLQEALSNAVKHSGASSYRVSLRRIDDELQLEIVDGGHGFDAAAAVGASGLGLVSMQERLGLVNGKVVIESKLGTGTTVRASVPLQPDGAVDSVSAPQSS